MNRMLHIKLGENVSSMSYLLIKTAGLITAITGLKKAGSKNNFFGR